MMRRTRFAVAACAVGVVFLLGRWAWDRLRFPPDPESIALAEKLAPYVRDYFEQHQRFPSIEAVEKRSLEINGVELCPGGGVPGIPCLGYNDGYIDRPIATLRYPTGFDDYHVLLVLEDAWLGPGEFQDFLVRTHSNPLEYSVRDGFSGVVTIVRVGDHPSGTYTNSIPESGILLQRGDSQKFSKVDVRAVPSGETVPVAGLRTRRAQREFCDVLALAFYVGEPPPPDVSARVERALKSVDYSMCE